MNTQDIVASLGLASPSYVPPKLIAEIHAALVERDELRAALRQIGQTVVSDDFITPDWVMGIINEALGEVGK